MIVFDGKALADQIAVELKDKIAKKHLRPKLAIVAIDPDARSSVYINAKRRRAEQIGVEVELFLLNKASQAKAEQVVRELASDKNVHGIIVQLPLPKHFNNQRLIGLIPDQKDIDGMNFRDRSNPWFQPATILAILEIIKRNRIDLEGKNIAIVGRGEVGLSLKKVFEYQNLQLTLTDKGDDSLERITRNADVVISAVGQPNLVTANMIKDGAVVIDIGVSKVEGKTVGDVDFENVKNKASFITPPIGGVGPMTVIMLMQNVVQAAEKSVF